MMKKDLVEEVHKELKEKGYTVNKKQSLEIFDMVTNTITSNISKGKTVELSGFGIFSSKLVKRRNIKTNEAIERWGVYFKCSKIIKNKLNGKA